MKIATAKTRFDAVWTNYIREDLEPSNQEKHPQERPDNG